MSDVCRVFIRVRLRAPREDQWRVYSKTIGLPFAPWVGLRLSFDGPVYDKGKPPYPDHIVLSDLAYRVQDGTFLAYADEVHSTDYRRDVATFERDGWKLESVQGQVSE